jgi:AraC-like DNA-binding protein
VAAQLLEYAEEAPAGVGAQVARAIWSLRGHAADAPAEPVVPDGRAELVFNFADPFEDASSGGASRQPRMMLVGPTSRPVFVRPTGAIDVVGVRLEPWAVAAVCRAPANELRDRTIALDELSPDLAGLAQRLGDAPPAHRSRVLSDWLAGTSGRVADSCNTMRPLVQAIRAADRPLTVAALAQRFGRSVRAVQRAFARDVGLGPKTVFRLSQVQRALRLAREAPPRSWARIAARAGYYDQSHLVRDFRELVGLLPSQFRADAEGLTAMFVEG